MAVLNAVSGLGCGLALILLIKLGIDEFKRLSNFLKIIHSNTNQKHSKKIMRISLVKYLLFLFILTVCTHGIFIYPLIVVWLYCVYLSYYYIKLWKYHGHSAGLLIFVSLADIASAAVSAALVREYFGKFLSEWGGIFQILAMLALIAYTIFSKEEKLSKEDEADKNRKQRIFRMFGRF